MAIALAAAAGIALLTIQDEFGFRLLSPRTEIEPAATPAAAVSTAAANLLELSVLDQPRELPEIRFNDAEGRDLTLADFRGKVVLLNIWATWCVPCRKEMPALGRLQAQLGGGDFLVIALSIDRAGLSAVKPFFEELKLQKLGIYLDPSGTGSRALGAPGVPATLLIDREGREVARKMGAAEWDGPEIVGLIRQIIEAQSGSKKSAGP